VSDRIKTSIAIAISLAALVVIVVGLGSRPSVEPSAQDRIAALSASIKCPFCNGESLADSGSGVAADYRSLIAERVAAGYSDAEIRQEFADNFGDSFILDTSTTRWSILLWIAPIVVLVAGAGVIVAMRRAAKDEEMVS
jgi:cytochrome c-type biogenesis protein CcmH